MKIQWTHVAFRRLDEIYGYIENDSPTNAEKWVDRLLKKLAMIKDFPKAGRSIPEVEVANIREIVYGNYGIVYKIKEDAVYIMTIRHFKQILPLADLDE